MSLRTTLLAALAALPLSAAATPLTFEIESYNAGNFSASWIHSADGCYSDGLYMCADWQNGFLMGITDGSLTGNYADGVFSDISGSFSLAGGWLGSSTLQLTGGSLGGDEWYLEYILGDLMDTFYFEQFSMGSGMPNAFSMDNFVLWGQNSAAYGEGNGVSLGIDLYGDAVDTPAVDVPEPGTLLLLGAGLAGIGFTRRRRQIG